MSICPAASAYRVAWICALSIEYVAACELLDQTYPTPPLTSAADSNVYTCGRIGDIKVVVACLPKGKHGLISAATVSSHLRHSFPSIEWGLLVGIGGGAPSSKHDIRLGDVVVGVPSGRYGGVIPYDYGRTIQNQTFQLLGHLNAPPRRLLSAVQHLDARYIRHGHDLVNVAYHTMAKSPQLRKFGQRPAHDRLYRTDYVHRDNRFDCHSFCGQQSHTLVSRPVRRSAHDQANLVSIHYGTIASADKLMKDALVRNHLADTEGVLCFEMEAAGLMNVFPCLVIRGISDYADTHKADAWQGYAALIAAVYAKDLLLVVDRESSR